MTLEEIRKRKWELHLTNEELAQQSGVPLSTVRKVLGGSTASPRYGTLKALEDALFAGEAAKEDHKPSRPFSPDVPEDSLKSAPESGERSSQEKSESSRPKDASSQNSPDPENPEDPVFREKEPQSPPEDLSGDLSHLPSDLHSLRRQILSGDLYAALKCHVRAHSLPYSVIPAPARIQISPSDEKTILVPDLSVLRQPVSLKEGRILGSPDLVIEILSPRNWRSVLNRRAILYERSGVREFWAVSPDQEAVTVMDFDRDSYRIYRFEDTVPVGILPPLGIDFREIRKDLSDLLADDPGKR